ncbi:hypothetical protein D9M72_442850 [compost metagenome]
MWGPSSQGAFAAAKSWFDVLVVVGCFGFPQSCVIAINRNEASRKWLYEIAVTYSAILFPFFAISSFFLSGALTPTPLAAAFLAFGAASWVLINIWRGILLTINDGLRFHLITILPTIGLVLSVFAGLMIGADLTFKMPHLYGISGIFILLFGFWIFPWVKIRIFSGGARRVFDLISNGADVFVQALATVLQTFICLKWLSEYAGISEVSYFSISLTLMNALIFPLQAISPVLLNRWSKGDKKNALQTGRKLILSAAGGLFIFAGGLVFFIPHFIDGLLGEEFAAASAVLKVAIFVSIPSFILKINNLRLSAIGDFRFNSLMGVMRIVVFFIFLEVFRRILKENFGAFAAAVCWLGAEIIAALISEWRVFRFAKDAK